MWQPENYAKITKAPRRLVLLSWDLIVGVKELTMSMRPVVLQPPVLKLQRNIRLMISANNSIQIVYPMELDVKIRIHVYQLQVKWHAKVLIIVIGILFVLLPNVHHTLQSVYVIRTKKKICPAFGLEHPVENWNAQMLRKLIIPMKIARNSSLVVSRHWKVAFII